MNNNENQFYFDKSNLLNEIMIHYDPTSNVVLIIQYNTLQSNVITLNTI